MAQQEQKGPQVADQFRTKYPVGSKEEQWVLSKLWDEEDGFTNPHKNPYRQMAEPLVKKLVEHAAHEFAKSFIQPLVDSVTRSVLDNLSRLPGGPTLLDELLGHVPPLPFKEPEFIDPSLINRGAHPGTPADATYRNTRGVKWRLAMCGLPAAGVTGLTPGGKVEDFLTGSPAAGVDVSAPLQNDKVVLRPEGLQIVRHTEHGMVMEEAQTAPNEDDLPVPTDPLESSAALFEQIRNNPYDREKGHLANMIGEVLLASLDAAPEAPKAPGHVHGGCPCGHTGTEGQPGFGFQSAPVTPGAPVTPSAPVTPGAPVLPDVPKGDVTLLDMKFRAPLSPKDPGPSTPAAEVVARIKSRKKELKDVDNRRKSKKGLPVKAPKKAKKAKAFNSKGTSSEVKRIMAAYEAAYAAKNKKAAAKKPLPKKAAPKKAVKKPTLKKGRSK